MSESYIHITFSYLLTLSNHLQQQALGQLHVLVLYRPIAVALHDV